MYYVQYILSSPASSKKGAIALFTEDKKNKIILTNIVRRTGCTKEQIGEKNKTPKNVGNVKTNMIMTLILMILM